MANNVYIGSRYVPIFDGTWSNSKSYEPLTIVEYGNSSYTSKRQVPAGTLPTNTTYWALTGNYNGQISSLNNRVTSLENDANNNIKPRLSAAENNINTLEASMSLIENRNIIFVGDSYAVGSVSTTHYPEECASAMGLDSSHYHVLAHSGWGFANSDYYNLIHGYSGNRNIITDIVVLGGLNDAAKLDDSLTDNALLNLIETFVNYCKSNFPNAKIWIGVLGWSKTISASSAAVRHYNRIEKCYRRATQWGAVFIDGFLPIVHDYNMLSNDDVHPNDNGQMRIGRALASRLNGGDLLSNTKQLDITLTSSQTTTLLPNVCFQNANNENITLFLVGTIEFTNGISFTLHQQRNILTMSKGYINSGNLGSFVPVLVEVTDNSNNVTWEIARLVFSGYNINIAFQTFVGTVKKIKFNSTTIPFNIYTA